MADTIDLVFTTRQDNRPILDNADATFQSTGILTNSNLWQLRAEHVQKMFDGVTLDPIYPRADRLEIASATGIDGARDAIDDLGSDRIRNLFFIGHGSDSEGFMFSGKPSGPGALDAFNPDTPRDHFMLETSDVLADGVATMNANIGFIREIAEKLAPNSYNGIYFMSCFTGAGELPLAMEQQLRSAGAREFFILSWRDFYQTNAVGEMGGQTNTSLTLDGTTHNVSIPKLDRFMRWEDRIIHPDSQATVATASRDRLPRAQEIHGHGQASVFAPLGILP